MMKKIMNFVKKNRKELLQIGLMVGSVAIPQICSAGEVSSVSSVSSSMPWNTGLRSIAEEVTGPIPKLLGIIAVAAGGGAMMFGEMGAVGKLIFRMVFGIGMAIGAVNLVNMVSSGTSGLTF